MKAEVVVKARARAFSDEGIRMNQFLVSSSGDVRVWDSVAGYYTTVHALSKSSLARVLKLALNKFNGMEAGELMRRNSRKPHCEIEGCYAVAVGTISGIYVCDRCEREYVSVGLGAVYFAGRWHGVRGALYTDSQIQTYPGLDR